MFEIYVDNREPKIVQKNAKKLFNVKVEQLSIGDVQDIQARIVIERKEVKDFLSSIVDSRLKEQAINMQPFPFRYVIIEGDFDKIRKEDKRYRKYSNKMIAGKIASLEVKYNISVLKVKTNKEFWLQVERLIYKLDDDKAVEYSKIYKPKISVKNKKHKLLSAICTVQGVSETKGELITKEYKKISEICKATKKDLMEIPGVGPVMARNIKEVFK